MDFGNFFRVLDVAFMVPGFVVLLLAHDELLKLVGVPEPPDTALDSLIFLIAMSLSAYILGFFVHGITRILLRIVKKSFPEITEKMASLKDLPLNEDIPLYLWNTSSVCFNIGTAVLIGGLFKKFGRELSGCCVWVLCAVFVFILWFLGIDFKINAKKVTKKS